MRCLFLTLFLIFMSSLVIANPYNSVEVDRVEIDVKQHVNIVSTSEALDVFCIDCDEKEYIAEKEQMLDIITSPQHDKYQTSRIRKKWVWQRSKTITYKNRKDRLINA